MNRSYPMETQSDSVTGKGPQTSGRCLSGGQNASDVFGFPISANQFNILESNQTAEFQCPREDEMGLVDPRTTRHLRAAASRAEARGSQTKDSRPTTVHYTSDAQGISGTCVEPVASKSCSSFFVDNSFSASPVDILDLQSAGPVQIHWELVLLLRMHCI